MDKREKMVVVIRKGYGLDAPRVLAIMLQVPREKFVSEIYRSIAYDDGPVPIGYNQTMSQPYTVAFMTHLLLGLEDTTSPKASRGKSVLEVGTGSGYQAAVLSGLFAKVYSIEIVPALAKKAKLRLKKLGYKNVEVRQGSGEYGWRKKAPFDAIVVTAGIKNKVPDLLFEQLKEGGVLVAPIGVGHDKVMTRFRRGSSGQAKFKKEEFGIFSFVPFIEE